MALRIDSHLLQLPQLVDPARWSDGTREEYLHDLFEVPLLDCASLGRLILVLEAGRDFELQFRCCLPISRGKMIRHDDSKYLYSGI